LIFARVIKGKSTRLAGNAVHVRMVRKGQNGLETLKERYYLEGQNIYCMIILKSVQKKGCEDVEWIHLFPNGNPCCALVNIVLVIRLPSYKSLTLVFRRRLNP
jgi:hypothetical protein